MSSANSSTEPDNDPPHASNKCKIFPRNLTARADYIVNGNPAISRPESAVGISYPGLEVDERALERAFFPGLVFEFHHSEGAILPKDSPISGVAKEEGLNDTDLPLYLWGVLGKMNFDEKNEQARFYRFKSLSGPEVWRRIRSLSPGRIAIVLGPTPTIDPSIIDNSPNGSPLFLSLRYESGESKIIRENGIISVVVFVGDRARYIDEDGIIDLDAYPPGELTRTMCSPWQYDFTDCGCWYWAANKPDLVSSGDGRYPYLDFQRSVEMRTPSNPPKLDVPNYNERSDNELTYSDMFSLPNEYWNKLPVVRNDRESESEFENYGPSTLKPGEKIMTRQEVIDELDYLATVEHALCVEYLYAHYSINAPPFLPFKDDNYSFNVPLSVAETPDEGEHTKRIFAASREVFMIAVDEMRHFRWVNESLNLLGVPPSIKRANIIGRHTFKRPFELKPLTKDQLQWFIDVEKPSQALNEGIDGMYVSLHRSIDRQPNEFPERERLVQLIKLIIDEGQDHYKRFSYIQHQLSGLDWSSYGRDLSNADPGTDLGNIQDICDANYAVLLQCLFQTFSSGEKGSGKFLEAARRAMFILHDSANYLASKGVDVNFKLPSIPHPSIPLSAAVAHTHIDTVVSLFDSAVSKVKVAKSEEYKRFAERQEKASNELLNLMHKYIREVFGD